EGHQEDPGAHAVLLHPPEEPRRPERDQIEAERQEQPIPTVLEDMMLADDCVRRVVEEGLKLNIKQQGDQERETKELTEEHFGLTRRDVGPAMPADHPWNLDRRERSRAVQPIPAGPIAVETGPRSQV